MLPAVIHHTMYVPTGLPVPTDFSVCYSLDLRPGYENHVYAYATWRIESPIGMYHTIIQCILGIMKIWTFLTIKNIFPKPASQYLHGALPVLVRYN